jgi:hypothetical protein
MLVPLPVQTTYQQYEYPGQLGTPGTMVDHSLDNRILEDPTGNGAGFGLAVCQGYKSDKGCTLGQLSGGAFVGITRSDITLPRGDTWTHAVSVDKFYDTDNVPVHTFGDIWVAPLGIVAAGNPVYFNSVTGQLGPSTIANPVLIPNATWQTSLPNGSQPLINFNGLAVCRLGSMA